MQELPRPPDAATTLTHTVDVVVIGAGQAGLSTAYHLRRQGSEPCSGFVVLDANDAPGGAWQHRWPGLTMRDVHGVAALPGSEIPPTAGDEAARAFVPRYFAAYEHSHELPVLRPVTVSRVDDADGALRVATDAGTWRAATVINATGTWDRPFVPYYPGLASFEGRSMHAADYTDAAELSGLDVVVVGGGHSAVQILGELARTARTTWVTRRPPLWRSGEFDQDQGRKAVALVEDRVRHGLPPQSVVSVTGLSLREQERYASEHGAYRRLPMFDHVAPDGVRWADGTFRHADVIVWATGFRPALSHLTPLGLREPSGGIALEGPGTTPTTATRDPRVQLVGYGPSASTIGANRAGRVAARAALRQARVGEPPKALEHRPTFETERAEQPSTEQPSTEQPSSA